MNKTVEFLMAFLRCEILGSELPSKCLSEISEEHLREVYALAGKHGFAHLIADVIRKHTLPAKEELKKKLQKEQLTAIWRYERIRYEQERILSALECAGIDHLLLKGETIRKYYPEPWMRTSCDIDVLVRREDLEHAVQVLVDQLQYKNDGKLYHDVSMFSESGVHLELHFSLNVNNPRADYILADIWQKAHLSADTAHRYAMDPTFQMFYVVAHMSGHFLRGGCGVRSVLDLWLLEKNLSFNAEELKAMLEESSLLQFYMGMSRLAEVWFDNGAKDAVSAAAETYILGGGNYGTAENRIVITKSRKGGETGYWYSRLFLSRDVLQGVYPELENRPLLYPYYQVKRWLRFLDADTRKRIIREFKKGRSVSGVQILSAGELLGRLGLQEDNMREK